MKFRIREVDPDDEIELLRDLHDQAFGDEAPMPDFSQGWSWLVWDPAGNPAGFAQLVHSSKIHHAAYLQRVGVMPLYRGHGLQRRLIRVREAKARKLGFTELVSDTTDNPHSANNLARQGFTIFEPADPWGRYASTIYWHKVLK